MKKGTQLEYMLYIPGYRDGKALKQIYEVANVTDSAGSTYSTIVKNGIGIRDEKKDHYEKTIRLQCDGKNLLLPFDFYSPDTTWFNDGNTISVIKRHVFFTGIAPLQDPNANYIIPLALEGATSLPEGVKEVKQTVTRAGTDPNYEGVTMKVSSSGWKKLKGEPGIYTKDYECLTKVKDIKVRGKVKITTAAGTFECYIIGIDCDVQIDEMSIINKYTMYYNSELGLVKMDIDMYMGKRKVGSSGKLELISIKK